MPSLFQNLRSSSACTNFRRAGVILALVVLAVILGNFRLSADQAFNHRMFGHDFLPFYSAGQIVREGHAEQLYDPAYLASVEGRNIDQANLIIGRRYGAFLNPPFVALGSSFLAAWPYEQALAIWSGLLIAALAFSVVILPTMLPREARFQHRALIPLLLFTALPAWQAFMHAQNTFISLAILGSVVSCWRADRALLAGLLAGALLYKPQLGVLVACVLVVSQGRRAAFGFAITASALLLANLIYLPGTITDYLHRLPENLRAVQVSPQYTWDRHVTFLAFWRVLLQGHVGALPSLLTKTLAGACTIAFGLTLGIAAFKARSRPERRDSLIAATIVCAPLLMPYYVDYDLTLLVVAAVLTSSRALASGYSRTLMLCWVGLYVACEISTAVAGSTRLILAVPALVALGVVMLRPLLKKDAIQLADLNCEWVGAPTRTLLAA